MPFDGFESEALAKVEQKSGGKIDNRSRKERRKETGEDFTPTALVDEILN